MNEEMRSIIDWLSYRSYEHNRMSSPHVPYYKWRKIYSQAIDYEEIYENYLKNTSKGQKYESIRTH